MFYSIYIRFCSQNSISLMIVSVYIYSDLYWCGTYYVKCLKMMSTGLNASWGSCNCVSRTTQILNKGKWCQTWCIYWPTDGARTPLVVGWKVRTDSLARAAKYTASRELIRVSECVTTYRNKKLLDLAPSTCCTVDTLACPWTSSLVQRQTR